MLNPKKVDDAIVPLRPYYSGVAHYLTFHFHPSDRRYQSPRKKREPGSQVPSFAALEPSCGAHFMKRVRYGKKQRTFDAFLLNGALVRRLLRRRFQTS